MNHKQHQKVQKLKNNEGWTTMETLLSIPLLVAAFMLIIYFGMMMQTQLALTFAANAAVRQLAKTRDCGQADFIFNQNFGKTLSKKNCDPNAVISKYEVEYVFQDVPLFLISVPSTTLKAHASTVTEKLD